jgi:hypothetical protein
MDLDEQGIVLENHHTCLFEIAKEPECKFGEEMGRRNCFHRAAPRISPGFICDPPAIAGETCGKPNCRY